MEVENLVVLELLHLVVVRKEDELGPLGGKLQHLIDFKWPAFLFSLQITIPGSLKFLCRQNERCWLVPIPREVVPISDQQIKVTK